MMHYWNHLNSVKIHFWMQHCYAILCCPLNYINRVLIFNKNWWWLAIVMVLFQKTESSRTKVQRIWHQNVSNQFYILTLWLKFDHMPITFAFHQKSEKVSERQFRYVNLILDIPLTSNIYRVVFHCWKDFWMFTLI